MIIGECRRYMRDNNTIRVSRSLRDIAYKAIYTRDILTKKNDREPTVDEIAKELELPKEDIVTALDAIATPMSLFEPVYQEGQDVLYLMDQVKDKKNKETQTPIEKVSNVAVETEAKSLETDETQKTEEVKSEDKKSEQPPKPNPLKKIWDTQGIVGILDLLTNVAETANNAVLTLFRGLHIYSLYVMILVGGGDADLIARAYGTLCKYYYPLKGMILNGMKVDNFDDYIQPDFLAERTEFEFQLIASINVKLILKVGFKAIFISVSYTHLTLPTT